VFLSHTADLRELPKERSFVAAAEAAVIRAGHAVTDMAYFTARDHAPADYCERMVADASIYVGIMGTSYGTPVRGRPNQSYTELEYEAATRLGLPRLIFLTRDDSGASPPANQPTDYANRQGAFRKRLLEASDLTVAWIASPGDLEIALFQALVELWHGRVDPKYPNRLRELRGTRYSQEEMAAKVDVNVSTYRSWEDGSHRPRSRAVRALCEIFDVPERELGFGPVRDSEPPSDLVAASPLSDKALSELPEAIQASQDEWRRVRRHLAANAADLTRMAAALYPRSTRVASTPLLTRNDWIARHPIDLRDVRLDWLDGRQRKTVNGTEPDARLLFPLRRPGHQFESYTSAVRYLDRPTVFENRPTFRLLEATMADSAASLRFSLGTYFEMIDVGQALAHEFAATQLRTQTVSLGQLPFRSLIGDPFDLRRRPVQAAINALTLRWDAQSGSASFLLHWRDPSKVAVGGGMHSVMPVGVFQPSTVDPWGQHLDFDLWRNLVREFSEEFLGMPEHDGSSGAKLDYDTWPLYRTLTSARDAGKLRAFCFGLGFDPLGLGIDILTAVVIDSELFDDVFGDLVRINAEGRVVHSAPATTVVGFPFTEESVHRFLRVEPMGPGGAACVAMAWQHRTDVLSI
jgi:transcriptional regulator with XRE-family HTH domain